MITNRERMWRFALYASRLAAVLVLLGIMLEMAHVIPRVFLTTVVPLWWIVIGAGVLVEQINRWRLRKAIARAHELVQSGQVRICPHCDYNLGGLSERAPCPECGIWFGPQSLRADWEEIYERLHRRAKGR